MYLTGMWKIRTKLYTKNIQQIKVLYNEKLKIYWNSCYGFYIVYTMVVRLLTIIESFKKKKIK